MADNLTTFTCRLSWNLGASASWNPLGISRPVMGLLCLFMSLLINRLCRLGHVLKQSNSPTCCKSFLGCSSKKLGFFLSSQRLVCWVLTPTQDNSALLFHQLCYIYVLHYYRAYEVYKLKSPVFFYFIMVISFHWHNPPSRTMALGLAQPLTEMSTRNISWGIKAAGA